MPRRAPLVARAPLSPGRRRFLRDFSGALLIGCAQKSLGVGLITQSGPRVSAAGGGGSSFAPVFVGTFDVGTNGQPCNTEYSAMSAFDGTNPIVYASGSGLFGETKVGRVQLNAGQSTASGYYYGGHLNLPAIPWLVGDEVWVRLVVSFNPLFCVGGVGNPPWPEDVNGALKWFRAFFDTNNRLTLLMGRQDNGAGEFPSGPNQGTCASSSVAPVVGMVNSEISTTNVYASSYPVIARGTPVSMCWYIKAATGTSGIMRYWMNSTLLINATAIGTKVSGINAFQSIAAPGDYYNGGPVDNNYMCDVSNAIVATGDSPPPWTDSNGFPFIPETANAFDYA